MIYLALSIPLAWVLYAVGIQYQRGGWWRVCIAFALPALLLSALLNYTLLALVFWDVPRRGEYTFSERLRRLIRAPGWRGKLARLVKEKLLDPFDPDGVHIKE